MPQKGMQNLLFSSKILSTPTFFTYSASSSPSRLSTSTTSNGFSDSVMAQTLELAEPLISKWDADSSSFAKVTSLFHENRNEANDFIKCVKNLHKAMHLVVGENLSSKLLVQAHNLMEIAMKRLQKEFYQILSMNRDYLDPESVSVRSSYASTVSTRSSSSDYDEDGEENEIRVARELISEVEDVSNSAMDDLKLIAECMILCGYGKECMKIYKIIRKSIIDEGIYRLGVEKINSQHIQKLDWEVLELKINNWLNAVKTAVDTLFNGEKILCDHVFATSDSIKESVFSDISKDGAAILFGFPEIVVRSKKKSPRKVFRILDMYTAISNHWLDIESIFSTESTSSIRSQAITSLIKLGDSVKTELTEFESMIQKDKSKSLVAGAGIHHLTVDVMNYLSLLADYSGVLSDIIADLPPISLSSLPESYFNFSDPDSYQLPEISLRFAWLILVLLCKLDVKSEQYKDISFSYLFLANNLQYVISKVRTSNLRHLLCDEWISKHETKVKQFAANYERQGWGHVISSLPVEAIMSPEEVKESLKRFNVAFEHDYHKQSACVIPNSKLRDEIKLSIAKKVMPAYRELYNKYRAIMNGKEKKFSNVARFAPDDLGNQLSDLFFGTVGSGSYSSSSSSVSHSQSL